MTGYVIMPKTRKMLCDREALYIQSLKSYIETQSKETLAKWAIDYAEQVMLPVWNRSDDLRPHQALQAAREWLSGAVKLPVVKAQILKCHAAAREAENDPAAQAAARAIGHCASTVHSARHCIGLAFYGALAVAYADLGTDAPWKQIEQRAAEECKRMENALRAAAAANTANPLKRRAKEGQ